MDLDLLTDQLTIGLLAVALVYLATKTLIAVVVFVYAFFYSENVTKDDPLVRAEADAYSAAATRAMKNYLSNWAERHTGQNPDHDTRMATERLGQKTGRFEARLISEERAARRQFRLGLFSVASSLFSSKP